MSFEPGRAGGAQKPPPQGTRRPTGRQPGDDGAAARPSLRPRQARQARFAQGFARVVAVLMRDPNFRTMPIADLEWLVLPAVMSGQFRVAEAPASLLGREQRPDKGSDKARAQGQAKEQAKEQAMEQGKAQAAAGGILVPVAVALWARVSKEIDAALAGNLDQPVRLKPNQWASGDSVWLVAAAGDRRALPKLIDGLAQGELKGQRIRMRVCGPGNTVVVKTLGEA
jgi:hemolysin-activating ACP:hemolysin acyltransferase